MRGSFSVVTMAADTLLQCPENLMWRRKAQSFPRVKEYVYQGS
jgi:hypothetical protein